MAVFDIDGRVQIDIAVEEHMRPRQKEVKYNIVTIQNVSEREKLGRERWYLRCKCFPKTNEG